MGCQKLERSEIPTSREAGSPGSKPGNLRRILIRRLWDARNSSEVRSQHREKRDRRDRSQEMLRRILIHRLWDARNSSEVRSQHREKWDRRDRSQEMLRLILIHRLWIRPKFVLAVFLLRSCKNNDKTREDQGMGVRVVSVLSAHEAANHFFEGSERGEIIGVEAREFAGCLKRFN